MPHAYLSVADLKRRLDDTTTSDDAAYRAVLEGVSQEIDNLTARRFQPYSAVHYYTGNPLGVVWVDDLLTVAEIASDADGSRSYSEVWGASDYDLMPFNATYQREPYQSLQPAPAGTRWFPTAPRGVRITGVWGYWLDTVPITTLGANVSSESVTTITVASAANFSAGHTLLVDSEQMYATSISGTTVTVQRGMNGTTAATHSSGAAVAVYRYPTPIVEACAIQAARIFRRKDAPFGTQGSEISGWIRVNHAFDPDALLFIKPYRRVRLGVG